MYVFIMNFKFILFVPNTIPNEFQIFKIFFYNTCHLESEFGIDTEQLRFGKVRRNVYSLDFKYPFSPIQAFGCCMSTFAKKMLVT
eukprot:GSMAST32.ASY1.ANO1.1374.1 assembled CDS